MTRRALAILALLLPGAASAQGALSTLGFGYPGGQFSTRALGTGGALAEIDPLSATNPAAVASFGTSALYFQAEPEYRTLHVGTASERTTIARYPMVSAAIPITPTVLMGLSISSLLDRSFETSARGTEVAGDTTLATTNTFKSDGAIGDLRVSLAWLPQAWLRLGVAAHAITGDNRVKSTEVFDDSTRFARLVDTATVGYIGNAFSAGFETVAGKSWSLAGSYRRGGHLSLKRGDTTVATANVPDRLALSGAFLGIHGTTLAVRTARDTWSRMNSLGSVNLHTTDSWDTSVGADVLGPRLGSSNLQLRVGARSRTLPFGLASSSVSEKSFSLGAGSFFAQGRAALDFAAIRAARDAGSGVSETAWTLSVGVLVRP